MITITIEHLDLLLDFQYNANESTFCQAFGEALGLHLWAKFENLGGNLLALYNQMDDRNTAALIAYLNQRAETDRAVLA